MTVCPSCSGNLERAARGVCNENFSRSTVDAVSALDGLPLCPLPSWTSTHRAVLALESREFQPETGRWELMFVHSVLFCA